MRCRRDGTLIDIPYVDLDIAAGTNFEHYLAPFDRRKGRRFLEAVGGNRAVLDRKLNVATTAGMVPLFFSAATSGATLVIIATRRRFESGHSLPDLAAGAARNVRSVQVALRKMEALQRSSAGTPHAAGRRKRIGGRSVGTSQVLRLVAHDLTNPISGILAASQFLQEDAGNLLDVHQSALLKSIESSSEFALQFIESILELHSIPSSKFQLRLQATDLSRLVAECIEHFRRRAESRRIALELKATGTPTPVDIDRRRITQAISALVRNELERLEPGSRVEVAITTRDEDAEIVVHSQPPTGSARTIQEEHGGSAKRTLNQVRTDLSLSAVSRIVKAHRGRIRDKAAPDGGAVFRITLPASAPARKTHGRYQRAGRA
jgi:signal transduction histidine kinase